jgi:molybdopterin-guanine dinucleotide biosynthesis protein A
MLKVSGVILAGGQSERMGGKDKGLIEYQGLSMVQQVAKGFDGVMDLQVNANRNHEEYQALGFNVFADANWADIPGNSGPLLGILSGLQAAKEDWVLFSPCDTPELPHNYCTKMSQTASDQLSMSNVVFDGERRQNLHLLLHKSHTENLHMYLLSGRRKTYQWLDSINALDVNFSGQPGAFKNVNGPEDL